MPKKKTTESIHPRRNTNQEIDIDITPMGLMVLAESLAIPTAILHTRDVITVAIKYPHKTIVLRFHIIT